MLISIREAIDNFFFGEGGTDIRICVYRKSLIVNGSFVKIQPLQFYSYKLAQ